MGEIVTVVIGDVKVFDLVGCDIFTRLLCSLFLCRAIMKLNPTIIATPPRVAPTPTPALAAVDRDGAWVGIVESAEALVPKLG